MFDSVREELKTKISAVAKPVKTETKTKPPIPNKPFQPPVLKPQPPVLQKPAVSKPAVNQPAVNKPAVSKPAVNQSVVNKPAVNKSVTAEIGVKPTSPTLVEFQNKNATMPEWRLQLKNDVRKRMEEAQAKEEVESVMSAPTIVHRTHGSAALKAEVLEEIEPITHENEKVRNALRRIEQSRRMFYVEEEPEPTAQPAPKRDYPFYIAAKTEEAATKPGDTKVSLNFAPAPKTAPKPKLVSSLRSEKKDFDTNKLPPLPAKIATSFENRPVEIAAEEMEETPAAMKETTPVIEKKTAPAKNKQTEIRISRPSEDDDFDEIEDTEYEEFEDCAPFAMRFNSGVFDLLIGSFASLILLSPFVILGGEWFTPAGLFAFLATCAVVLFIYMTTAIGLFGKTFGMKMFSLEIIDIEENDYPSFHQAAVSSSVYLLSLALGGSGFLTVPFTAERRAVHDLVSGTIIVREYESEEEV